MNTGLNAAHKLLTESREPHHTCLVRVFLSEWRVPAHLSAPGGAPAPILLVDPSASDAPTTRCLFPRSPVEQLSLLHLLPPPHSLVLSSFSPTSSLTTIHTHTHTRRGGGAQRHPTARTAAPLPMYGGPEALERIIVQMRTHILASQLDNSWTSLIITSCVLMPSLSGLSQRGVVFFVLLFFLNLLLTDHANAINENVSTFKCSVILCIFITQNTKVISN